MGINPSGLKVTYCWFDVNGKKTNPSYECHIDIGSLIWDHRNRISSQFFSRTVINHLRKLCLICVGTLSPWFGCSVDQFDCGYMVGRQLMYPSMEKDKSLLQHCWRSPPLIFFINWQMAAKVVGKRCNKIFTPLFHTHFSFMIIISGINFLFFYAYYFTVSLIRTDASRYTVKQKSWMKVYAHRNIWLSMYIL